MIQTPRRIRALALVTVVTAAGALTVPALAAPPAGPKCGSVITTNTTLAANIGPCAAGGLVIGADGVVLDLAGYSISGKANRTGDGTGIRVAGRTGVVVKNGTVRDFDAGVAITSGSTGVTVDNILAKNNVGSTKRGARGDGIAIVGSSSNTIVNSDVIGNGPLSGIGLVGASTGNLIVDNVVSENGSSTGDGIRIEGPGAASNTVRGNTISANGREGVAVLSDEGTGQLNSANVIEDNVVAANGFGFAARPGDGIRTLPTANDTIIRGNEAHDNAGNGINITSGSLSNDILTNTATGNGRQAPAATAFDLRDGNDSCDANVWSGNVFGTAFPACTAV